MVSFLAVLPYVITLSDSLVQSHSACQAHPQLPPRFEAKDGREQQLQRRLVLDARAHVCVLHKLQTSVKS